MLYKSNTVQEKNNSSLNTFKSPVTQHTLYQKLISYCADFVPVAIEFTVSLAVHILSLDPLLEYRILYLHLVASLIYQVPFPEGSFNDSYIATCTQPIFGQSFHRRNI